jgi:hypothetical protein
MKSLHKFAPSLCALLALAAVHSPNAVAIPITGSIALAGTGTGTQVGGINGTSTLTFNNPMTVSAATLAYAAIPLTTPANFAPISWIGSGINANLTSNNNPEWTIVFAGTTYQFALLSLTNAIMDPIAGTVSIVGTGVATIAGTINRDPTFAIFSIAGPTSNFAFTFVPTTNSGGPRISDESSALLLLGVALVSLALFRRTLECSRV